MENVFDAKDAQNYIDRINNLTPETKSLWGKMMVDQMLAHCNVSYEMVYEPEKHKKPGSISKFILKSFVKPKVVGEKAYTQNGPTAPQFIVSERKDFEEEKKRLIGFIQKTQQLGTAAFDGKESFSFGKLKAQEWNNMFAKHLNHHLAQFGV
ncbi:hypothetical protein GCM10022217_11520 [Chryseobacterium ginsenosidimutans]|uniref:DUF1569 domain-containing protein n=1 Tax=Chryseobacterium ginsenosidimutans TaxID=687846 RepID=UPI0031DE82FD